MKGRGKAKEERETTNLKVGDVRCTKIGLFEVCEALQELRTIQCDTINDLGDEKLRGRGRGAVDARTIILMASSEMERLFSPACP